MDLTLQTKLGCALIGAGHFMVATGMFSTYQSLNETPHPLRDFVFGGFVGVLTTSSLIGILHTSHLSTTIILL